MRKLRTDVYVNGVRHLAGTVETKALAKSIPNPKAWESEPEELAVEEPVIGKTSVPPMTGEGSDIGAWRAYATEMGFEADEDATLDEIIATLESEGIPTE